MALRRLEAGGQPVYVIEVDVPKVTDSRGKGYGTLVSDLRWKLWEEVTASQLQQMKFEQMTRQAKLDVLEQKQRDISRAIRDAYETQAKLKSGAISPYQAQQLQLSRAKANRGTLTVKTEPARDPFTGELIPDQTVTTRTTRTPIGPPLPELDFTTATAEEVDEYNKQAAAETASQMQRLDTYIEDLKQQQTDAEAEFQDFISRGVAPQDLLSRTRDAFGSQIGEGGFGLARRRLREVPRFDEAQAAGRVQDTIAREEQALLAEALRTRNQPILERMQEVEAMGPEGEMTDALLLDLRNKLNAPLTLDEERRVKQAARDRVVQQLENAGAQPTGRAGFLLKEMPPSPRYVPSTPERPPAPRGDISVESTVPAFDRATEIKRDLDRLPVPTDADPFAQQDFAEGLQMELEDVRAVRAAGRRPPPIPPVDAAIARQAELDALGASPEEAEAFYDTLEARFKANEAIDIAADERLAAGRLPRDRGFTYPVETIAGVPTTTGGRPGGLMDRITMNRLGRTQDVSGSPPVEPPMVTPTPTTPVPQVQPPAPVAPSPPSFDAIAARGLGKPAPVGQEALPEAGSQEDLGANRFIIHDGRGGGTVYERSGGQNKTLFTTSATGTGGGETVTPEEFKTRVRELKKGGAQDLGKAKSTAQRRELYAMNTIKKGLELADKPKQFARLAKTDNPVAAPEYIKLVNGVYEMNGTSPNRFKLTYDEVARVYRNDDKMREKALSYLVAKDTIESNVTRPMV